jgi:hypothetical protein
LHKEVHKEVHQLISREAGYPFHIFWVQPENINPIKRNIIVSNFMSGFPGRLILLEQKRHHPSVS